MCGVIARRDTPGAEAEEVLGRVANSGDTYAYGVFGNRGIGRTSAGGGPAGNAMALSGINFVTVGFFREFSSSNLACSFPFFPPFPFPSLCAFLIFAIWLAGSDLAVVMGTDSVEPFARIRVRETTGNFRILERRGRTDSETPKTT